MLAILSILGLVCGIGSLVCWIMVVVAAFKSEESPLMGILCIVLCALGAFIIGWIKSGQWGIRQVMLIWSGLIAANIVIQVITVGLVASMGS